MIRIFAIDDHEMFRAGFRKLLESTPDIRMTGEASSGAEAFLRLDPKEHDVVLLDITLVGDDGMKTLSEIRRRFPGLPVFMVSALPVEHYGVSAIRKGAKGYLCKTGSIEALLAAIRKVAGGKMFLTDALSEILVSGNAAAGGCVEALSERELQVLRMIADGRSGKEVSAALEISERTVATYKTRILKKTGRKSTAELIRYALDHGIVA